jgi:ribosomal protein S14
MDDEREFGLSVAASFTYPYEADLAKALLESREIEAWILDEHQIRQRWHLSGALGGVKVSVRPSDLEEAKSILAKDFSVDLAKIPEASLSAHPDEICPSCGSPTVLYRRALSRVSVRTWVGGVFSLLAGLLFPLRTVREDRSCQKCGANWSLERPS